MKTLPLKAENFIIKYKSQKVRILMLLSPTSTQYLVGAPNGVLDGFVRRRVRVANLAFDQTN